MSLGLLGKKVGMTHVYNEEGAAVPVTVVDVSGNEVLQVKSKESDGYDAVQVGFDAQKEQRINKPAAGHFKKHGASEPKRLVKEFRYNNSSQGEEGAELPESGKALNHRIFQKGQYVDVVGTTKGKGFQGVYRKYNFGGLRASHGSMMHRRPGAIGAGSTPARVWKNQKMPGQQGGYQRTVQNLEIVETRNETEEGEDLAKEYLLIRGNFPGAKGSYVMIRPAKKKVAPEPLPEEEPIQEVEEPVAEVAAEEEAAPEVKEEAVEAKAEETTAEDNTQAGESSEAEASNDAGQEAAEGEQAAEDKE